MYLFLFSEVPNCLTAVDCLWDQAQLSSESLTGQYSSFSYETWKLLSAPTSFIEINFNYFDIGCDFQSLFEIEFTPEIKSPFCNLNRPVQGIRSLADYIVIKLSSNQIANMLIEGFSSVYEIKPQRFTLNWMITKEDEGMYRFCVFFIIFI